MLKPGDIVEGPFFPEPVRILSVHNFGESVLLEAVGVHNGQFFSRILSPEQLER